MRVCSDQSDMYYMQWCVCIVCIYYVSDTCIIIMLGSVVQI